MGVLLGIEVGGHKVGHLQRVANLSGGGEATEKKGEKRGGVVLNC